MNKSVVILVANGFDEVDFTEAQRALTQAGLKTVVVSVETGLVNSWRDQNWGHHFPVDANVSTVLGSDYDCLYVPGGERSVNKLVESAHAKRIIRSFIDADKPVAMQGNADDLLVASDRRDANIVHGAGLTKNDTFLGDMIAAFTDAIEYKAVA